MNSTVARIVRALTTSFTCALAFVFTSAVASSAETTVLGQSKLFDAVTPVPASTLFLITAVVGAGALIRKSSDDDS